jgi:hypothetical protein
MRIRVTQPRWASRTLLLALVAPLLLALLALRRGLLILVVGVETRKILHLWFSRIQNVLISGPIARNKQERCVYLQGHTTLERDSYSQKTPRSDIRRRHRPLGCAIEQRRAAGQPLGFAHEHWI